MRIVSQNRSLSVDFDRVIVLITYDDTISCKPYGDSEKIMVLGRYAPNRAMEVFQDIHNAYAPADVIFENVTPDEEFIEKMRWGDKKIISAVAPMGDAKIDVKGETVYYMPED